MGAQLVATLAGLLLLPLEECLERAEDFEWSERSEALLRNGELSLARSSSFRSNLERVREACAAGHVEVWEHAGRVTGLYLWLPDSEWVGRAVSWEMELAVTGLNWSEPLGWDCVNVWRRETASPERHAKERHARTSV